MAVSLLFLSNIIISNLGVNNFLLSVLGCHRLVSWELFSGRIRLSQSFKCSKGFEIPGRKKP